MAQLCDRSVSDSRGQDLIEYGLLAMFIAIVAYVAIQVVGGNVLTLYDVIPPATSAAATGS